MERAEFDSLGTVMVPADHYWGAQTQRSLQHFAIDDRRMPIEVYRAYGYIKKAAAIANAERLPDGMSELIQRVADEVIAGDLDDEFPLYVWQTGSGTHTNMNVNEVIANRCIELLGGELGSQEPVKPNDHINMSQSSNDTFPTAMHVATYTMLVERTLPALGALRDALTEKAELWADVLKVGRTHLQDATPLTVGQEWSGYAAALGDAIGDLEHAASGLLAVALGGTAVGTGMNAPHDYRAVEALAEVTGYPFVTAPNLFAALATSDRMVRAHAAMKGVAVTLFKIANDLRWLGSGPRAGLGELRLPANEPGSSIMPGKVNPSQAEAMLMVCIDVMASDVAVQMCGAEGNFELNTFRPLMVFHCLQSARSLAGMSEHFREYLVEGAELDRVRIQRYVDNSVMVITALAPHIGYHAAAQIAHRAVAEDLPLRDVALAAGVPAELFDEVVGQVASQ